MTHTRTQYIIGPFMPSQLLPTPIPQKDSCSNWLKAISLLRIGLNPELLTGTGDVSETLSKRVSWWQSFSLMPWKQWHFWGLCQQQMPQDSRNHCVCCTFVVAFAQGENRFLGKHGKRKRRTVTGSLGEATPAPESWHLSLHLPIITWRKRSSLPAPLTGWVWASNGIENGATVC